MIAFLSGEVAAKEEGAVVLDVNGVGYRLHMAQSSIGKLPHTGEKAKVLCSMSVSDAGIFLYGFIDSHERDMFEKLVSVSGVGPKMALAALSIYDSDTLSALIASQDIKALSKVPGIGKKTASRIALELKDTFDIDSLDQGIFAESMPQNSVLDPVIEALSSMGFTSAEISQALEGVDTAASESAMLQYALRRMS